MTCTLLDEVAVPDRLEQRVREAEHHQVLDGLLAQEVVDPVDRVLFEVLVQQRVELDRALQIAPERLLDHDPAALRDADARESLGHVVEQEGRDREVADGMLRLAQRVAQRPVGGGIAVVAADVAQPRAEPLDDGRGKALAERVPHFGAQLLDVPVARRHADHRDVERARRLEAGQRAVELLVREIPGDAEEDECVALHAGGFCST